LYLKDALAASFFFGRRIRLRISREAR